MRLLICTQVVDKNHSNLGSFHRWLEEFAKHCERIEVICLWEGEHNLPGNVRVHSLGKDEGANRITRLVRLLQYAIDLRRQYDAVFVHMNPEYLIAAGWLWRYFGKKTSLWYTHKSVNLKLRMALWFTDVVFTASRESFRLESSKVRVVGHGIDTLLFHPGVRPQELQLITVGRITKSKRLIEMLAALDMLFVRDVYFDFMVVGAPIYHKDERYQALMDEAVAKRLYKTRVHMDGPIPYEQMPATLAAASVFLNLSETGSIDRAVLEAMACGVVPASSNEAFREILSPLGLYIEQDGPQYVVEAILKAQQADPAPLIAYVRERHSLQHLVPAMLKELA